MIDVSNENENHIVISCLFPIPFLLFIFIATKEKQTKIKNDSQEKPDNLARYLLV